MFQVFLYMSLILEHNETEEESRKVDEFSKTYFVMFLINTVGMNLMSAHLFQSKILYLSFPTLSEEII